MSSDSQSREDHGLAQAGVRGRSQTAAPLQSVHRDGAPQWVRNVQKNPRIKLSVGGEKFEAQLRFLADPAERDCAFAVMGRAMRGLE